MDFPSYIYNALNVNDQDSLNSAAGGNFLDKMPLKCLKIIKSKSKVRQSRAKAVVAKVSMSSSTIAISSKVFELKDLVRALLLDKKNQSSAHAQSSTPAPIKAIEPSCVTCGGTHSYQNCPATSGNIYQDNIQEYEDPLVDPPEVPMADNRTMAELLQAPTEGYKDAIDSLNSAAGGNFLDKMPLKCLKIIKSKSKVRQSRAKAVVAKVSMSSSTIAISSKVFELKDLVRALLLDKKNQSSAHAQSSTPAPIKAIEPSCVTCGGTHSYQNCPATSGNIYQDNIQEVQSYLAPRRKSSV
nr:hypothetical protein [Tanacetum cinerariifolium]